MKTNIKLILLLLTALIVQSCDQKLESADYLNNRTPYLYFTNDSQSLFIKMDEPNQFDIDVRLSGEYSKEITYTISVDPSSVAQEDVDFTLPSKTITIPSGQLFSSFKIECFFDQAIIDGKKLVLNLTSTDNVQIERKSQMELTLIKFCPINADFTGSYHISFVSGGVDAANFLPVFGTNIDVDLTMGSNDTERIFNVKFYPDFGFANPVVPISFSLVCGDVIMNGNLEPSGIGCGGANIDVAAVESGNSVYNPNDDSSFDLTFLEDFSNGCGDSQVTVYHFEKN